MKNYKVVWDEKAVAELKEIHDYIKKDSAKAATKVKDELLRTAKELKTMPRKYKVYEFANEVEGEYRSVIRWSYRIIYEVLQNDVHVVRIIHTSRDPLQIIL